MPTSAATRSAVSRASPVSSTGVSPSAFSSAIASALVGLTVSRTASAAREMPSQLTSITPSRRPTVSRPSTTPWTPTPGSFGSRSRPVGRRARCGRPATACAIGCSDADSTAPARRSTSARVAPLSRATSASSIFPSVTVPVLSRTMRRDPPRLLEHFGAFDEDAELRAAPGSTISAVGVASPSRTGRR